MINGLGYDWEGIDIILPTGVSVSCSEISYSDERPIENIYGKGSAPRKKGRGNYKASASFTLDKEEALLLQAVLGGSVYGQTFFIVVKYANDELPMQIDTINNVDITKQDTGAKQGEKEVGSMKYDCNVGSPILWNGIPAILEK
jgi:hypothetical protein